MCRFLAVRDSKPFPVAEQLARLAVIARRSREYQGDGWGCAWREGDEWREYHAIVPIWEDRLDRFGDTALLLAHARSAFRNEGITVSNTMPFIEGEAAFIFNGELRGVRLEAPGRIGAEKLFHVVRRFGGDTSVSGLRRSVDIVVRRTSYVRAMNFVLATGRALRICSRFSEDPGYFTLHLRQQGSRLAVSSEPWPGESGWAPIANGSVLEFA